MSKEILPTFRNRMISHLSIRALNGLGQVEEHCSDFISFINPHQVFILEHWETTEAKPLLVRRSFCTFEYARAILAPDYFTPSLKIFEMTLLEIGYPSKFQQLNPFKILGNSSQSTRY